MPHRPQPTVCYVDESIHSAAGFVVTAFVFASGRFEAAVAGALRNAGLVPKVEEFKSGARMASNGRMQAARSALIQLAGAEARLAVFFGPHERGTLGKHSLQALQSILLRNGLQPSHLAIYFDEGIFPTEPEARRLRLLFHFLRGARVNARVDSRLRLGIQVADAVAHSFGQVLKEELTGRVKLVDIGGPGTGYPTGAKAPLGWHLLTILRRAMMTRPMVYRGERYAPMSDPVVLDPVRDDPVRYGQHPVLLGWGVQVDPEASTSLRLAVDRALGRLWLGCVH